MIMLVLFAPLSHGQIGLGDELAMCLTPIAVAITLLLYRLLSWRAARQADRNPKQQHRRRAAKRD
jgi:hypothetical protein